MDPPTSFNPHPTIGACEIGDLITYALFGVTTVQAYIYYGRFPNDDSKLKALVTFVWYASLIADFHALKVVTAGHAIYTLTISDFGQFFQSLGPAPKSVGVSFFAGGITVRIGRSRRFSGWDSSLTESMPFTKKLYIPMISWCMLFVRLLGTTAVFVTVLQMTSLFAYQERWGWLLTTVWCISAANDLTITAALVANLISHRSHIHKRTVVLVDKLVMWTIETGMLTSIMTVVAMVCFVTMKDNFIWLGVYSTVPGGWVTVWAECERGADLEKQADCLVHHVTQNTKSLHLRLIYGGKVKICSGKAAEVRSDDASKSSLAALTAETVLHRLETIVRAESDAPDRLFGGISANLGADRVQDRLSGRYLLGTIPWAVIQGLYGHNVRWTVVREIEHVALKVHDHDWRVNWRDDLGLNEYGNGNQNDSKKDGG
ncbi:hypothetical protein B0H14DRAFT_3639503 [Mycena olivaceomarginata]|nr:hypothetical protein B0H14DRAFT_3639503 [Mycena olivaceomarginata]